MKKSIMIISVTIFLVAAIAFKLMSNKEKIDAGNVAIDRSAVPVAVAIAKAVVAPVENTLNLPAELEAGEAADVSVGISGKINSLKIELGSSVTKGQVIGKIDTKLKELNLESTELTIQKLEKDYQRNQELLAGNATTETSVIDAKYNYENNKLQASQIRQQIKDGDIIAPISGIITAKNLVAGEYVNPGVSIAKITDVYRLKAVVFINEKDIYAVKTGQTARVSADVFPGKTFTGKVAYISPVGDENHNYKVELSLANTGVKLKAGTYVQVQFELGKRSEALQIPKAALADGLKNPFVYLMMDGKAEKRKIVPGRDLGESIEVISGLKAGDEVVISGQINLFDGANVEKIPGSK